MLVKKIFYLFILLTLINSCNKPSKTIVSKPVKAKIFTTLSTEKNTYKNFNSPNAINTIATIENNYFNDYNHGLSNYYGTVWYETLQNSGSTVFKDYTSQLGVKPDSMHCTIYALKSLKAGLGSDFKTLEKSHKQIWKNREYAGWSVAYILTTQFNWTAYLMMSEKSVEYEACLKNFKKDKTYHVWKQPNIPIKKIFDFDSETKQIDSLLTLNEYGWGFSHQGWHTWITRHDTLKECNWTGAPSKKYDFNGNKPLFIKTKFTNFYDYDSHIIVFPPKKD
jgi:hypothetical protein